MIAPQKTHRFVESLCAKLVPTGKPIRVPIILDPLAKINECFINVPNKIASVGGSAKFGWCIWELPGLFIEAEAHSIWVTPSNQIIDITPKQYQVDNILFLEDPSVTFNETDLRRRDNVRMAIKDHPVVHEFLKSAVEYVQYIEDSTDPSNPRLVRLDERVLQTLAHKKMQLEIKMVALEVERNDMCRCGSAQKYKKCCGR